MNLGPGTRVHIVGVGGAGMSGLARLLAEMGCAVTGCDAHDSAGLADLRAAGVDVAIGHEAHHGASADVVLWSPAVAADNVELAAARSRGATLLARAEVLAELGGLVPVVAFTGTHGKTTATSMAVQVSRAAGRDDSWLLGAPVIGVGANGHWGTGSLILEADESYGTFAQLAPAALGVLNVEADHLDHYGSLDALEAAFASLVTRATGPVVAWADDPGARRVSGDAVTVGSGDDAAWRVRDVLLTRRGSEFALLGPDERLDLDLRVVGAHNVANAAVVAVLARSLGVETSAIVAGLAAFQGAPRRFQLRGRWRGSDVIEDYAHLPGEIAATLAAARAAGYQRITAVFQPHRITRTISLAGSFAPAFDQCEHVVVTDIYAAGEPNPDGVTGELVERAVAARHPGTTFYAPTFDDVLARLDELSAASDLILLLGAGDVADVTARLDGGLTR